tara:strand:- start:3435 stop:4445 length:1011 start_codon:yes stop_codon:yes gene_type:complete
MIATILPEQKKHHPVLLQELISIISPQYGGKFIDCTFGQGGYTKKILEFSNTEVIAIDRDANSGKISKNLEKKYKNRILFKNIKFSEINKLNLNKKKIKAIVFDLGYSLNQMKDPNKCLSFNSIGELNMKLGLNEFSAKEVVNNLDKKDLEKIFKYFGNEKDAKKIASVIERERVNENIDTQKLVKIIESSKRKKNYKIHSATKIFQAIRIFVNKEISELIYGLINATKIIEKDGIIAVVTFHSIEDKIVKYFFKSLSEAKSVSRYLPKQNIKTNIFKLINKKAIIPTYKEVQKNPTSRSAKLRFAIKIAEKNNFESDFLEKFKNLIEIENYSAKL